MRSSIRLARKKVVRHKHSSLFRVTISDEEIKLAPGNLMLSSGGREVSYVQPVEDVIEFILSVIGEIHDKLLCLYLTVLSSLV